MKTLNWKGDDETWAEAHAARAIGGKYSIRLDQPYWQFGVFHPFKYSVDYTPRGGGPLAWLEIRSNAALR